MPSQLASVILLTLSTLALASPLSPRAASRTGKVFLHKTSDGITGKKVGCLDVSGRLILESSACASYTVPPGPAITIARTSAGECGMSFADEPQNPDTGFPGMSAFRCKSEGTGSHDAGDQFDLVESQGVTQVFTVLGSGANDGVFTKKLPAGDGDAVDVFTRGFNLGEGSIDMLWTFQDI
ncbi:unnamed protein product [Periconia digitata]|uniref:Uncharacterized protein n=1 Tax=Periconia digitata TaxID=1303443 RepID=A0A9W4UNE5_9PLEO|nr:unnamed protein product [Periconia digitata]